MCWARRRQREALDAQTNHSILSWERDLVRAAVVHIGDGVAEIIGVASAPLQGTSRTARPDVDRWFAACSAALTEAEDATALSGGKKVVANYVTMGIPSELISSLPVMVERQRRSTQDPVTADELEKLLRRSYRTAQDILAASSDTDSRPVDIVSGDVCQFVLDGQWVDDPVGLHGESLELHVHYSLAPHDWVRALQLVAERLQTGLAALVPHQVSLARPLPNPYALLVQLDHEHTVISGLRRGRMAWTERVDCGERQLVQNTAAALSLRERQAPSLMRVYRARQLSVEAETQVAAAFWAELRGWMDQLGAAARPHLQDAAPRQVFVADETRRMPEALASLTTPYWEQSLPFGCCPDVVEYEPAMVRNVLDCTGRAGGAEFLRLRALAHGVTKRGASASPLERLAADMIRWR
ncbi:MAG: hypothetical protein GX557_04780 [Chloroflexi bacterium]|nr:hypothetical protein [Chloroflexota bacterium]